MSRGGTRTRGDGFVVVPDRQAGERAWTVLFAAALRKFGYSGGGVQTFRPLLGSNCGDWFLRRLGRRPPLGPGPHSAAIFRLHHLPLSKIRIKPRRALGWTRSNVILPHFRSTPLSIRQRLELFTLRAISGTPSSSREGLNLPAMSSVDDLLGELEGAISSSSSPVHLYMSAPPPALSTSESGGSSGFVPRPPLSSSSHGSGIHPRVLAHVRPSGGCKDRPQPHQPAAAQATTGFGFEGDGGKKGAEGR